MKKNSFLLLVLCTLLSTINAQTPLQTSSGWNLTPDEKTMQILNSAEYIFEGENVESVSYFSKDSSKKYLFTKIKVITVYKGSLKEGEFIELYEERMNTDPFKGGKVYHDLHYPSVGKGERYILFCKKTSVTPITNPTYNLPVKLSYVSNKGYIEYAEDSDITMFGLNHIGFKSKQDFENLLLKINGVTIPKKKVQTTPSIDSLQGKVKSFEDFMLDQNQRANIGKANKNSLNRIQNRSVISPLSGAQSVAVSTNNLSLNLANDSISSDSAGFKYYEFDIITATTAYTVSGTTASCGTNTVVSTVTVNNCLRSESSPEIEKAPSSVVDHFVIYPNPFTSQTTISFTEQQTNTTIKIIDVLGSVVRTINFSGNTLTIERGELSSGTYVVEIMNENKNRINTKIIIQ